MIFRIRQNSSAIHRLTVNPITGTARVQFTSSRKVYRFEGVSRRAMLSALAIRPLSMGQWVNRHCLQRHSAVSV